eukprot:CAMPEP_0184691910 /NCGR_PEP_ID=MMETSP0313-20130426/607_1 /TAXON_ID=2792 /ORGANISM="Porphyridium aerugineum, Strain SAG 1380-2" /LENGTH=1354 /DNA_ID=CAMNT_0027149689 /DNA_START=35 /DNA_END=4099 /DNA_ORIENTATION=-
MEGNYDDASPTGLDSDTAGMGLDIIGHPVHTHVATTNLEFHDLDDSSSDHHRQRHNESGSEIVNQRAANSQVYGSDMPTALMDSSSDGHDTETSIYSSERPSPRRSRERESMIANIAPAQDQLGQYHQGSRRQSSENGNATVDPHATRSSLAVPSIEGNNQTSQRQSSETESINLRLGRLDPNSRSQSSGNDSVVARRIHNYNVQMRSAQSSDGETPLVDYRVFIHNNPAPVDTELQRPDIILNAISEQDHETHERSSSSNASSTLIQRFEAWSRTGLESPSELKQFPAGHVDTKSSPSVRTRIESYNPSSSSSPTGNIVVESVTQTPQESSSAAFSKSLIERFETSHQRDPVAEKKLHAETPAISRLLIQRFEASTSGESLGEVHTGSSVRHSQSIQNLGNKSLIERFEASGGTEPVSILRHLDAATTETQPPVTASSSSKSLIERFESSNRVKATSENLSVGPLEERNIGTSSSPSGSKSIIEKFESLTSVGPSTELRPSDVVPIGLQTGHSKSLIEKFEASSRAKTFADRSAPARSIQDHDLTLPLASGSQNSKHAAVSQDKAPRRPPWYKNRTTSQPISEIPRPLASHPDPSHESNQLWQQSLLDRHDVVKDRKAPTNRMVTTTSGNNSSGGDGTDAMVRRSSSKELIGKFESLVDRPAPARRDSSSGMENIPRRTSSKELIDKYESLSRKQSLERQDISPLVDNSPTAESTISKNLIEKYEALSRAQANGSESPLVPKSKSKRFAWEQVPEEVWRRIFELVMNAEFEPSQQSSSFSSLNSSSSSIAVSMSTLESSSSGLDKNQISRAWPLATCSKLLRSTFCGLVTKVDFSQCAVVNDTTSQLLSRCPNLCSLTLSKGWKLKDSALVSLTRCRNVQTLQASACEFLTDEGVTKLATNCTKLQDIIFPRCSGVTDASIRLFGRYCHKLRHVSFSGCRSITDETLISLSSCSYLESINVSKCTNLTDYGFVALVNGCRRLHTVNVSWCSQLTDVTVQALSVLKNLKSVTMNNCHRIHGYALRDVLENCSELEVLSAYGCRYLYEESFLVRHRAAPRGGNGGNSGYGGGSSSSTGNTSNAVERLRGSLRRDSMDSSGAGGGSTPGDHLRRISDVTTAVSSVSTRRTTETSLSPTRRLLSPSSSLTHSPPQSPVASLSSSSSLLMSSTFGSTLSSRRQAGSSFNLRVLILARCVRISVPVLIWFVQSCPKLSVLDLSYCEQFGDDALFQISLALRCQLSMLSVAGCVKISNLGVAAVVDYCRNLTTVNFSEIDIDDSVCMLFRHLTRLRVVDLSGCKLLTDVTVLELLRKCPQIQMIDMSGCGLISAHGRFLLRRFEVSISKIQTRYLVPGWG